MTNEYTLPPLPNSDWTDSAGIENFEKSTLLDYGQACADAARAPLLDRIAELESLNSRREGKAKDADACIAAWIDKARASEVEITVLSLDRARLRDRVAYLEKDNADLTRECGAAEGEKDRLRAEVEALRSSLSECADDLESEVEARRSGDVERRIERDLEPVRKARALLAQAPGSWVNPMASEVEALRADADLLSDFVLSHHSYESNSYATRCLDCDADARKEPHKAGCVVLIAAARAAQQGGEG